MSKDAELRLEETVAAIPELVPGPIGENIRSELHHWLMSQPDRNKLSADLSFGWTFMAGADEKRLRHFRRALLLSRAYRKKETATYKKTVASMDLDKVKAAFLTLFPDAGDNAFPECGLAASFQYAEEKDLERVRAACRDARMLLPMVLAHLSRVRQVAEEKLKFEKWFGTYSDPKLLEVLKNYQLISSCPKRFKLYYRGPRLRGVCTEIVPPSESEVGISPVSDAGYYAKDSARDSDPHFMHIFLGEGFFGTLVGPRSVPGQKASGAGVIIHEASHYVCQTEDARSAGGPSGIMYGPTCCAAEALKNNPLCVKNADNYRLYADQFLT
jgi:hypothetical protein